MTSKKTPLTIDARGGLTPAHIEQLATTPGEHVLKVALTGATIKAITDRVRRVPRVQGWNALLVKVSEHDDKTATLVVANTGKKAKPWPKPAKKPTTKKAPAKAAAKKGAAKKAAPAKRANAKKAAAKSDNVTVLPVAPAAR